MIPAAFPRSLAILLLRFAIWIAPHDTLDWGRGMLSELHHVEGNWSALIWAVGGAGVLAKHAMLALILPGSQRRTVSSASELFAKELPMRKATLTATAACVLASLLFFLAPVFRQAFQVSLAQWHDVLHVDQPPWSGQVPNSELDALARKVEQNHDAEALAFVATRHSDELQRERFADEAVHLDPNLTWIYAINGALELSSTGTDRLSALKQWDPQNALPHLFAAQKIKVTIIPSKEFPLGKVEENPAWEMEMAAAFHSPKLDDYRDRLKELDHRVLARYHLDDPFLAASDANWYGFPSYGIWYCSLYAESLLKSGQSLESQGNRKTAIEKYWDVARFGQMMSADGEFSFFMRKDMDEAYARLGALSQLEGNKPEAAFYASLADQFDKVADRERTLLRNRVQGSDVSHWNALLVRLSGLLMLSCGTLLVLCALGVVIRNRSVRFGSLQPSRITLALGFSAAVGWLVSSAVLFVTYRPYSELLQRFLSKGDDAQLFELSAFLRDAQLPFGSQFNLGPGSGYVASSSAAFYFWLAVTLLCACALLLAVLLHFRHRRPATATAG
ncbi:MAG: hypothetical protein WCE61_23280 [Candidatus Acidiferrum sp.]